MDIGVDELLERQRLAAARQGYEFVFSVIVPVYNTAAYLEECIQSIMGQSVGFGDTQLVLVDDGSTDDSARICRRYAERFPSNVVFLQQENAGVSAARNLGLEHARGLWINFLDSDDLWSNDAFEVALRFSAEHPDVHMVSMRHWFFGAFEGPHPLDYKYESDRVIDILRDADVIQLSFSNMFVQAPLLAHERFDPGLDFAEDFKIVGPLMLRERYFGVCKNGSYRYRKRSEGGSAIDTTTSKMSYYEKTPYVCNLNLFHESKRLYGEVIPYAQWCVMYELQFRLRTPINESLSAEAVHRYRAILRALLATIDDEVIVTQRHMSLPDKLYALRVKYDVPMREILAHSYMHGGELYWWRDMRGVRLFPPSIVNRMLRVESLDYRDGAIRIFGWSDFLCEDARPGMRIVFRMGGIDYEAAYVRDENQQIGTVFCEDGLYRQGFSVRLPWNPASRAVVEARICFCGRGYPAWFSFGEDVGLDEHLRDSYWHQGDVLYRVQPVAPDHNRIVANGYDLPHHLAFKSRLALNGHRR